MLGTVHDDAAKIPVAVADKETTSTRHIADPQIVIQETIFDGYDMTHGP